MKKPIKLVLRSVVAITLLVGAGYAWLSTHANVPVVNTATAFVTKGDIEDSVSALGSLQPREFLDIGTQVSGQLKRVLVSVGDAVQPGSLLAEIDKTVFAARVEAGEATLRSLEAQIDEKGAQHELLSRQYERNLSMYKQNAVSKDALETSMAARRANTAQIATLRAQMEQTRATLKVEQANYKYTSIFSPIAGTVVAQIARQGQTLNANQQAPIILRIADLDTMTVVTQVSEADVVRLKPGVPVYFSTLGRPERKWSGKVRQILPTPETINNVVLYNVLFDVENADRELRTQMSAQVFFVLEKATDTLLVPIAALKTQGDPATKKKKSASQSASEVLIPATKPLYTVRVLKDGKTETRTVQIGILNRVSAQVVTGLSEGEEVLLDAAMEPNGERKASSKKRAKL
jgi:membrane fusion protein, macrolide-specific efflux system